MKKYISDKNSDITSFLVEKGIKKSDIKTYLKYRCISINENSDIKFNSEVHINDVIIIDKNNHQNFDILYEDNEMIVINKPCGLLTDKTNKESYNTAYYKVKEYVSSKHETIYLVHRLDQYTSGVLMFVKNKKLYELFTNHWNELILKRNYIGVVEGRIEPEHNHIETYLYENKALMTCVTNNPNIGKKAITNYHVIKMNKNYSLLDIQIETGRKNQIRAHLSYLGYPIVGDDKYGAKSNPIKRLALHANMLSFKHPINNKVYEFKSDYPSEFDKLVK